MFAGAALPLDQLTAPLLVNHGLTRRVHTRKGVAEVHFLARDADPLLPVILGGRLLILRWGNRRGESKSLPTTLWTSQATIEAGGWQDAIAEEPVILAALGLDNGIWFPITTGVRDLVVPDEKGDRRVFVVCEPASNYYGTMTKSRWVPSLIRQEWGVAAC